MCFLMTLEAVGVRGFSSLPAWLVTSSHSGPLCAEPLGSACSNLFSLYGHQPDWVRAHPSNPILKCPAVVSFPNMVVFIGAGGGLRSLRVPSSAYEHGGYGEQGHVQGGCGIAQRLRVIIYIMTFVCLYTSVCECLFSLCVRVSVSVCLCVCACAQRSEVNIGYLSQSVSTLFETRSLNKPGASISDWTG